jgi:antitoxin component of MazEF toxin-antitoxin module
MKTVELKVAPIGNSRGVRLPAETLKRYGIDASVVMEERSDGILLRPAGRAVAKLSWEDTAREMAAGGEDWSDWDAAVADGLADAPWDPGKQRRAAESKASYAAKRRAGKRG